MQGRRLTLVLGLVVVFAAAAYGGRLLHRQRVVARHLPPTPDLRSWPAVLQDRVADAGREAHSWQGAPAGLAALSRLYHANGFFPEALQCYQGLRTLEPGNPRWPHLAAGILALYGRTDEARPLWERTLALAPDYIPARIRLGEILTKSNRHAEAVAAYSAALQQDPGNPYALLGLARNDLARNDWPRARTRLEEAVQAHPDFVGALSLLVTVYDHDGEEQGSRRLKEVIGRREFRDIADPWLDGLIDGCYDPYRLSVVAYQATLAGDDAAARDLLERAVMLAPEAASYRRQLGRLFLQQRDYPAARRQLEQAVQVAPDDSDAWLLLVDVLTAMGARDEAGRVLAAGLAACPQSAALHYAQGHRLAESGFLPQAVGELQLAKKLRPSEANAYVDLALVYFRMQRIADGVGEMRAAVAVQPGHPLALQVLARDAINRGDEADARQWIRQLRLQPRGSAADLGTISGEFQRRFGREP